jgi:hypothetical protein
VSVPGLTRVPPSLTGCPGWSKLEADEGAILGVGEGPVEVGVAAPTYAPRMEAHVHSDALDVHGARHFGPADRDGPQPAGGHSRGSAPCDLQGCVVVAGSSGAEPLRETTLATGDTGASATA